MQYLIKRSEAEEIRKSKTWLIVYGRRKTGKTFMLRNLCNFKNYFLVRNDLNVSYHEEKISIEEMIQRTRKLLRSKETVVIDEFQRLNQSLLEEVMLEHPKGRLILSGSSMKVVGKVFSPQSPLLGFLTPKRIDKIPPKEILRGLNNLDEEKNIEYSTFVREPWLIPHIEHEKITDFVYRIVTVSKHVILSLLGEIFTEEEKELSHKYEAIISLLGAGFWYSKDLTQNLYTKKIIPDPSTQHIAPYLKNLQEMEVLESIKLYNKKNTHYYRLKSPIMNLYYYLHDRYAIGIRDCSLKEMEPTLQKLIQLEVQNFIADFFAEKLEGRKEYYISPEKELDFMITKRNKPVLIGEVKWKEITREDIEKFKRNAENFTCKKILIGKKSILKDDEIEILDAKAIVEMVEK